MLYTRSWPLTATLRVYFQECPRIGVTTLLVSPDWIVRANAQTLKA